MPEFRFPSTTNANLFRDVLDACQVKHDGEDDVVAYDDPDAQLTTEARFLGGYLLEPRDNSTIGVEAWTDQAAFSIRSNPPEVARGGEPVEPRGIAQAYQGGGQRGFDQPGRLLGDRAGKARSRLPARRKTRGQP
jgi:hypothetical protein